MEVKIKMSICHNCKGTGRVAGGQEKRIRKELKQISKLKYSELNAIKEKDKNKRNELVRNTTHKYEKLQFEKSHEPRINKSACLYCQGTGAR